MTVPFPSVLKECCAPSYWVKVRIMGRDKKCTSILIGVLLKRNASLLLLFFFFFWFQKLNFDVPFKDFMLWQTRKVFGHYFFTYFLSTTLSSPSSSPMVNVSNFFMASQVPETVHFCFNLFSLSYIFRMGKLYWSIFKFTASISFISILFCELIQWGFIFLLQILYISIKLFISGSL